LLRRGNTLGARSLAQEDSPIAGTGKRGIPRNHEVQFYPDDSSFLVSLTRFIELEAGNVVILAATESHRKSLLKRLQARGVDSAAAIEQGSYIPLDAAETLSTFMEGAAPRYAGSLDFDSSPVVILSAEQAKHVGDEENQQYCPQPYAGPAPRTPAGMAVVPSTEAKNQY
jgi:hypothetical protein